MQIRKTWSLGKHIKVTASQSGIGFSVGSGGVRLTKNADGRKSLSVGLTKNLRYTKRFK